MPEEGGRFLGRRVTKRGPGGVAGPSSPCSRARDGDQSGVVRSCRNEAGGRRAYLVVFPDGDEEEMSSEEVEGWLDDPPPARKEGLDKPTSVVVFETAKALLGRTSNLPENRGRPGGGGDLGGGGEAVAEAAPQEEAAKEPAGSARATAAPSANRTDAGGSSPAALASSSVEDAPTPAARGPDALASSAASAQPAAASDSSLCRGRAPENELAEASEKQQQPMGRTQPKSPSRAGQELGPFQKAGADAETTVGDSARPRAGQAPGRRRSGRLHASAQAAVESPAGATPRRAGSGDYGDSLKKGRRTTRASSHSIRYPSPGGALSLAQRDQAGS